MLRIFLSLTACLAIGNANAGLISSNGYTLDTDTNVVTGGGLEWLRWDQTLGLSINDVIDPDSDYAKNGWSVATNVNMASLYTQWGFGPDGHVWDTAEETFQRTAVLGDELTDLLAYDFTQLFGVTMSSGNGTLQAMALFGQDANGNGFYNAADVTAGSVSISWRESVILSNDSSTYTGNMANEFSGIALVRNVQPVEVSEPGALALVMVALGGLGARRLLRSTDA